MVGRQWHMRNRQKTALRMLRLSVGLTKLNRIRNEHIRETLDVFRDMV